MKEMNKMHKIKNKIFSMIGALSFGMLLCISIPELPKEKLIEYTISQTENYVFLGDSITDWYPIEENYKDYPIVNSGKAGYKTKDILDKLESMVYIYNPTKIFILIGTNDLNSQTSSKEILIENIKKIIENISENRPNAKIYLESIYPINRTDNEKIIMSTVGKRTNKEILEVNRQLKNYCIEKNIVYIDMYQELIDEDGNLKLDYTKDGLHLTNEGYAVVTKKRLQYMQKD